MARRNQRPLIVGLIVGGASLAVILAGCCGAFMLLPTGKTGNQNAGKLTRDEFKKKYEGQTKETVLKELGNPKSTNDIGEHSAWRYGGLTFDPVSGKNDSYTTIWIGWDGRVSYIDFN